MCVCAYRNLECVWFSFAAQPASPSSPQDSAKFNVSNMNKSSSQLQLPLGKMYFRVSGGSKDFLVGGSQDSALESEQTECGNGHRPHQVHLARGVNVLREGGGGEGGWTLFLRFL